MTRGERRQFWTGFAFVSPWVVGFLVFGLYPITMAAYYSFCNYNVLQDAQFVGLINYQEMLADDVLWKALYNTMFYAVFSVPLGLIVALMFAVLLNKPIFGQSIFRVMFYVPSIVPLVAIAMIWLWVFNGDVGLLNYVLSLVGIDGPNWLADPMWTKPTLILSAVWTVGGAMVLFLAGLQDVPRSLYESAELDGAGPGRQFWHITVPMVSPVIYFNMVMGIIYSIQEFVKPYVMLPDGGPDRSALFFAVYLYQTAFRDLRMGYASAMAMLMFVLIVLLTWAATKLVQKRIYYGGA